MSVFISTLTPLKKEASPSLLRSLHKTNKSVQSVEENKTNIQSKIF